MIEFGTEEFYIEMEAGNSQQDAGGRQNCHHMVEESQQNEYLHCYVVLERLM